MTNEAQLRVETHTPINMIAISASGHEKGSLMILGDGFQALQHTAASTNDNLPFAGVVHSEKIAAEGQSSVSVYDGGYFDIVISGGCSTGEALVLSETANMLKSAPSHTAVSGTFVAGYAKEDASQGERILVQINPGYFKQNG